MCGSKWGALGSNYDVSTSERNVHKKAEAKRWISHQTPPDTGVLVAMGSSCSKITKVTSP